ncbi:hypothetical protein INR49_016805%2C partial [Scomber scombrus]|uniref:Uncharacterized protein n=1 Tax=Scomber scombrus TaxID=13677 RepID=A0AAV1NI24_SCOSC
MCLCEDGAAAGHFDSTVQRSSRFHSEVVVDAVRQVGHALHLLLLLRLEHFLSRKEEEKGASERRGGRRGEKKREKERERGEEKDWEKRR